MQWRAIATGLLAIGLATAALAQETVSGLTEFPRTVELHAPTSGIVATINVVEGQVVANGYALIEMDAALQQARVNIAEAAVETNAAVERSEAMHAQARSRLNRISRAVKRGGASKWELEEARFAVAVAAADITAAKEQHATNQARLRLERTALEKLTLRAPFAGQVVELLGQPGQLSTAQDPLLVLLDPSVVHIVGFMPADRVAGIEIGQDIEVDLGSPINRQITAKLLSVDPRIEPSSSAVRIVLEFDNADMGVPSGVDARINVPDPR
jgi:RND family efflux transporter MFP subunit